MDIDLKKFANLKLPPIACGPGWLPLLDVTLSKIEARVGADHDGLAITCIEEKWGRLTIYFSAIDAAGRHYDAIVKIVDDAEKRSTKICDQCGAPGTVVTTTGGWAMARCEAHAPVGRPAE